MAAASRDLTLDSTHVCRVPVFYSRVPHNQMLESVAPHNQMLASVAPHSQMFASVAPHNQMLASVAPHKKNLRVSGSMFLIALLWLLPEVYHINARGK